MSKLFNAASLLSVFPEAMAKDKTQFALAQITAGELEALFKDNDFMTLYARIDELEEPLLDILAYDFKVDWWNKNYSLSEKREIFKKCWSVKRKLGTPLASQLAISSVFQDAAIHEWWEYGGKPYYFKIHIKLGEALTDYNKLLQVVDGIRYYKNKRSILESLEVDIEKKINMYVGLAMHEGIKTELRAGNFNPDDYTWLVDESSAYLTDENGCALYA